jgi:hypothetical protein
MNGPFRSDFKSSREAMGYFDSGAETQGCEGPKTAASIASVTGSPAPALWRASDKIENT